RSLAPIRFWATQTVPPLAAAACFGYAGLEVWRGYTGNQDGFFGGSGESQSAVLRRKMAKEAEELDQQRLSWVQSASPSRPSLWSAEVFQEVHNPQALGPAGVLLTKGEVVEVLEEGLGMEAGFYVVRRKAGNVGIYPKPYLQNTAGLVVEATAGTVEAGLVEATAGLVEATAGLVEATAGVVEEPSSAGPLPSEST
ncbi:unnamed protein product, partial [Polarella glacialis]